MKKNFLKNRIIPAFLLVFLMYSNFGQIGYSQVSYTGTIWVVPSRPDAFPVNGNRTGNPGINLGFENYHVVEYKFLDSLHFEPYISNLPIYQIRLQEDYASMEFEFMFLLRYCYQNFFSMFAYPYFNPYINNGELISTDNGKINIFFYDTIFTPTLIPRTNTSSYNKRMNLILRKYDIKSYEYNPFVLNGDTLWRTITILCNYQDALPLYHELQTIHDLFDEIQVSNLYAFNEIVLPCGPYSGISDEKEPTLTIFPNPANDEITISGVTPESVMMYDVMGKMVLSEFDTETNKINIKKLPSGLYIIKIISTDSKLFTNKIVKQ